MLPLETSISVITGIGPAYAKKLETLGITTVKDLIEHFPFRYDDFAGIKDISAAQIGEEVTIIGTIWDIGNVYTKSRKVLTKAVIQDGTGTIEVVWFNQPFLVKNLKNKQKISLSGKLQQQGYKLQLVSPVYEVLDDTDEMLNTGRLVPVYPETAGISSRWIRSKIHKLLPQVRPLLEDWMPFEVRRSNDLLSLPDALEQIHFPTSKEEILSARKRIAYDELLKVHLTSLHRKDEWEQHTLEHQLTIDREHITAFAQSLPFPLTNAQLRVIEEIVQDLTLDKPMNRLLEGDVGSGKTVVAAAAMYGVHKNGFQSAIMAPTEILANQHYETLQQLLEPHGVKISLVTGSTQRRMNHESGITNQSEKNHDSKFMIHDSDIVVGTHALVTESTQFRNLGLTIVDEQHKFGVEQRATLRSKAALPHVLTMTATPIPRTLALTLYGNLDLSVIDELPAGRSIVKTRVVPQEKRNDAYKFIEKEIKEKQVQAFIVCPFIEESENFQTVRAATVEYDRLQKEFFPNLRLGLLHGRMKPKEKDEVMVAFQRQELDILVATPLVEVGIDIPHATIMMIEGADRFGLAQLHQLRGRVGRRAGQEAYCFVFTELKDPAAIRRLRSLEEVYNGAELAEIDLQFRGAGELFGTKQHGIPNFKVAKLTNIKLIEETRKVADRLFKEYYNKGDEKIAALIELSNKKLIDPN